MACGVALSATLATAAPKPAAGATPAPTVTVVAPRIVTPGNSISEAAGFPVSNEAAGLSSLSVNTQKVGDLVVLSMQVHTTSFSITGVSGGNVGSWTKAESYDSTTDTLHFEVWWGVATGTGTSNITIGYSAPTSLLIELIADSFTSGASVPWVMVAAGGNSNPNPPGTSAVFPSLTSSGLYADQLYWGASEEESVSTAGGTPGFNYYETAQNNCSLYNAQLAPNSTYTPSCNVSPPAVSTAVGVIFALLPPTVTSVSPGAGPTGGGTTVTLTGTHFTGATAVQFGATAATGVNVVSDTSLTAVAPAGNAGPVDVTVTTPGGTSPTGGADQYIYAAGPIVTSVSPSAGPRAGGTTVTVSGSAFTPATAVNFGAAPASSFTVNSDTSLTAVAPAGSGTVNVTVSSPGGISPVVAGDRYMYVATSPTTTGGYDMVGSDGGVFVFPTGGTGFYGSLPGLGIHVKNIVGIVPTISQKGYWLVGSDGGVFAFGDAGYIGSLPGLGIHVNDIVGIVPTSTNKGYWLVGRDGGVFAFGDATYVQSLPGLHVSVNNIVGIAHTVTNKGYWLLGANGAVYALGDAHYYGGATGGFWPIVDIATTHSGNGYWLVGQDGSVYARGDAVSYLDLPTIGVKAHNIVSIVPTQDGGGYMLIGNDGGVFSFGDASFRGSLPGLGVRVSNVVGAVPTS